MSVFSAGVYARQLTDRIGIGVTLNPDGSILAVVGVEILRTVGDPNGVHAANAGSLALDTAGTAWINTDGATAWGELGGGGGGWTPTYGTGYMAVVADILNDALVLTPNGEGALLANIPDSTVSGGNPRGINSVDWQMVRTTADQVTAGAYGVISGGQDNQIAEEAENCVIGGGYDNTILNDAGWASTIGGGSSNVISSMSSVIAGGEQNEIHDDNSTIAGGVQNTIAEGAFCATISGGESNEVRANGIYSWAAGVNTIVSHFGEFAYGHGNGQWGKIAYMGTTSNATPKVITLDGSLDFATNRFTIDEGETYKLRIEALAVQYAGSAGAEYDMRWFDIAGVIRNKAGTVEFVGSLVENAGGDAAAAAWTLVATANDTDDCLTLTFTGEANKNIRIYATAHYTQLQIL